MDREVNILITCGCDLASDRSDDSFQIPDNSGISDILSPPPPPPSLSLSLCLQCCALQVQTELQLRSGELWVC